MAQGHPHYFDVKLLSAAAAAAAVCLYVRNNRNCSKAQYDYHTYDAAYPFPAVEPNHIVPAYGLESAPETVTDMHVKGDEPDDVESNNPPLTEGPLKQHVWILCLSACELLELHVGPEMCEMESDEAEHDDAEPNHVLRSERVSLGL